MNNDAVSPNERRGVDLDATRKMRLLERIADSIEFGNYLLVAQIARSEHMIDADRVDEDYKFLRDDFKKLQAKGYVPK